MKKIINIVLFVALLTGVASCVDLLNPDLKPIEAQIPDDAMVTLTFGVPTEIETKALGLTPTVTTMHVFLFNADGSSLITAAKAKCGSVTANYDGTGTAPAGAISHWSVDLPMSNSDRRIHFVGNLGEEFPLPTSGDEVSVMRSLITTDNQDAYWQRVTITGGIKAYTYDGSGSYTYVDPDTGIPVTVNIADIEEFTLNQQDNSYSYAYTVNGTEMTITVNDGDYITAQGYKSLDGKELYASKATSDAVALIPMVRNFVSLQVSSSWDKFALKKVALVNIPKAGYVAPYDLKNGQFVQAYLNATKKSDLVHSAIASTGYPATIPADYGLDTDDPSDNPDAFTAAASTIAHPKGETTVFMYERGLPTENATCLLVGGILNVQGAPKDGDGNTWFKIEITDEAGDYFPFFRDFTYVLDITGINGTTGYGSSSLAYEAAPVGDISSSVDLKHEKEISDGDLSLKVEYIDYTDLDGITNDHQVSLLYKFYYGNTPLNDGVEFKIEPYSNITPAVKNYSVVQNQTFTAPDGSSGWSKVNVTLAGTGESIKKSKFVVTGTAKKTEVTGLNKDKTLYRDVEYAVLPKTPLVVTAEPLCEDAINEETTVTIHLPNNLGYSVFPLTLMIEAGNNCLTSDALTVETGNSIQTNSTKKTFYFLKTVSYSEYQNTSTVDVTIGEGATQQTVTMRPFYCDFKTTKENNNAPTTIYVKDKSGRFDLASAPLTVETGTYLKVTPKNMSVKASATSAEFTVRTNATGTWTLTATNGASFNSSTTQAQLTGSGTQTVTLYFPANESRTEKKHYSVTAQLGALDDQLQVTQNHLVQVTRTVTDSQFSLSNATRIVVIDADHGTGAVTLTHGSGISYNNGDYFISGNNGLYTLTFSPSEGVTITGISLSYNSYNYRPGSISVSGGDTASIPVPNNSSNGSWNGESSEPLVLTMTRRTEQGWFSTDTYNFRFYTISVSYSYEAWE